MFKFLKLVRFIYPYRGYAFLNIFLNLISIFFSIGSLAMIIPFLGILFKTAEHVTTLLPWTFSNFKHNLYFYLTELVEKGPERALIVVSILIIAMTLLKTSFNYFASFFMAPVINGVVRDFQKKIYHKILVLPLGYFSNERKGDIMSRMTSDVHEVKFSIMSSLDMIFRDPLTILVYLGFLLYTSPQLTLFAFVALPIGGAIIAVIGKKLR
jgi:ATP-binding cassette, subfamily B, bacterial MsbA